MHAPYNPLDKRHLGESVVKALLDRPADLLKQIAPFAGAGVYAIYYNGGFQAYAPLSAVNRKAANWPIYVGKAVPAGARKGIDEVETAVGCALFNRLSEHLKTISEAENLDIDDFACRFLTVDDIWIPLAESLLIQEFFPLWNLVVEGFGNHDPGSGRTAGKRPVWDMIHPGRTWAKNHPVQPVTKMEEIYASISRAMGQVSPKPKRHAKVTESWPLKSASTQSPTAAI
jgi:hypothetical protein